MSTLALRSSALIALLFTLFPPAGAGAQTAARPPAIAAAPATPLVLVPYQEPGSTDPHALAISQALSADLTAAGVTTTTIAATDRIDAVANAAKICADNHASGLLVAEGRYEQTLKQFSVALFVTIMRYPTHVEFRLDNVGCDGVVRWSTTATGDQAPSGIDSVGNLGAAIDGAFSSAVQDAAHAFATATIPAAAAVIAAAPASAPAKPGPGSTYLMLPFEQPGVADPRAPDITHSMLLQLQQHKLNVKVGTPIDHFSAVATAGELCAANGAQAIIVPSVRVEQSSFSGRSHASLHLALLNCNGAVLGHGAGEADMGSGFIHNFGAAVVGVSERAMGPAIDQLFPAATSAN